MFSELEQYLDRIAEEENIPACDCIVCHGHENVFRHMKGYRDAAKTKPVSTDDRYFLYSVTKPLTMTAVMQLIEQGKLHLEDELCRYLPEFTHMYVKDAPAKNKITIKHLMTMTGGLNYDLKAPGICAAIEKNPNAALAEIVKGIAAQPLDFEPGTHFQYSLCHDVLGRVIEVVSKMSYGAYMKKYLFDPLGMEHTGYSVEEAAPYLTEQYWFDDCTHKQRVIDAEYNEFRLTPAYESGGAGLITTVDDYGRFLDAMCNSGISASGVRILSRESIDAMRTPELKGVPYEDFRGTGLIGYNYGLGVRTMVDRAVGGAKSPVGEFGWDGAAGSYTLIDVENQIGIFYAQEIRAKSNMGQIHAGIRDLVYKALLG